MKFFLHMLLLFIFLDIQFLTSMTFSAFFAIVKSYSFYPIKCLVQGIIIINQLM